MVYISKIQLSLDTGYKPSSAVVVINLLILIIKSVKKKG